MKIDDYKTRIIDIKIERYLKIFGAVSIEGRRGCGKTYSGRNAAYLREDGVYVVPITSLKD